MAPVNVFELFEKIQSADISVHQQRCVVVRNRRATCSRCADACTSGAISVRDNELEIQADLCVGCGTCATVCPTCALEAHRPNDAQLQQAVMQAARANDGVAVVVCKRMVEAAMGQLDTDKIVAVECLGRVEESLITALAAAGASSVVMVEGGCDDCELVQGIETARAVRDTSREILDTWNCPMAVDIVKKLPSSVRAQDKPFDESRRNFFFRAQDEARLVAGIAADAALREATGEGEKPEPRFVKVMDDGTLPRFVPDRRERILDNLADLGEPEDRLMMTRLWGHVIIDPETCDSCRMCATFCPTGAIRKFDDPDGTIGINHYPGDCVLCRCCEDICPTKALTVHDEIFAGDLLSGTVERNEMRPPKYDMSSPKKSMFIFRDILDCPDIYER